MLLVGLLGGVGTPSAAEDLELGLLGGMGTPSAAKDPMVGLLSGMGMFGTPGWLAAAGGEATSSSAWLAQVSPAGVGLGGAVSSNSASLLLEL